MINELNQILEEEDRKREEFYNTITEDDKAEFINGEVVMHSPLKLEHAEASKLLLLLVKIYCTKHDLGKVLTEKNDRNIKFVDYALHGVKESWLINPPHRSIEQYLLQGESYKLEVKSKAGAITSTAITGFTINAEAVFDEAENMKTIQQILGS